jgi:hypothetical protein
MKFHPRPVAVLAAVLLASSASAQLKLPQDTRGPAGASPGAPAATSAPASSSPATRPAASNGNAEKEAAGKLAAAGWLLLLDRRDWGTAWETSSAVFRGTVPLASWMDGIPKVREPFGKFIERSAAESVYKTTLEGRPVGDYVSVIFTTRFENKEVQEIVTTVREPDGKWRVTGYSTR